MRRHIGLAAAAMLLPGALTACATGPAHPAGSNQPAVTRSTQGLPAANHLGSVRSRLSYGSGMFQLYPPAPGQVPKVSWQDVVRRYQTGQPFPAGDASPSIRLAAISLSHFGNIPDGTLAYVLRWDGVSCPAPVGPVRPPAPLPMLRHDCTALMFVDAKSGTELYSAHGADL